MSINPVPLCTPLVIASEARQSSYQPYVIAAHEPQSSYHPYVIAAYEPQSSAIYRHWIAGQARNDKFHLQ
jgi:hypothetical protein